MGVQGECRVYEGSVGCAYEGSVGVCMRGA